MQTLTYAIIIEPSSTGYGAYAPDLPGCVATGATVEETTARMREALAFHLQGLQEEGLPITEPTTVVAMVTVSVPQ